MRFTRNLNPEHFYETNKHLDRWIRLQESINEIKLFNRIPAANEVKCELAVMVFNADLKYEKMHKRGFRGPAVVAGRAPNSLGTGLFAFHIR